MADNEVRFTLLRGRGFFALACDFQVQCQYLEVPRSTSKYIEVKVQTTQTTQTTQTQHNTTQPPTDNNWLLLVAAINVGDQYNRNTILAFLSSFFPFLCHNTLRLKLKKQCKLIQIVDIACLIASQIVGYLFPCFLDNVLIHVCRLFRECC